jgi:hypothetical protein
VKETGMTVFLELRAYSLRMARTARESRVRRDSSPLRHVSYAEKVRTLLGVKRLAWQSVQIPMVMPKPTSPR